MVQLAQAHEGLTNHLDVMLMLVKNSLDFTLARENMELLLEKTFVKYPRLKRTTKAVACLQIEKNIDNSVQDEFESNVIPIYSVIAFKMFSFTSYGYFLSRWLV